MLQFQTILEKSLNVKIKFSTSLIGGSYIKKKEKIYHTILREDDIISIRITIYCRV